MPLTKKISHKKSKAKSTRTRSTNKLNEPLIVAVSSRALFDFEKENKIFRKSIKDYVRKQRAQLNKPAAPGVAFPLVEKLLSFNSKKKERVRVVVISRNPPEVGLRVFKSIQHYGLDIKQGSFTRGVPAFQYLQPLGAHLFLSAKAVDVKNAINQGVPAAHVLGGKKSNDGKNDNVLRIAFDGDAVLFGDEAERRFQKSNEDVEKFRKDEKRMSKRPLTAGPFKPFLDKLAALQKQLGKDSERIRIALITARGAPAHERVIRTLMKWGINIDEAFFMDGENKKDIIRSFGADFYFDDQTKNVKGVPAGGHVPFGITNK